ncbi:MAG TPA: hypothetical protein PK954_19305, partial [Anaerolineales bacterium]|nr:hypothetical protein [Anaerolineales bacterium]
MSLPLEATGPVLWIGPAASGKTQACIDRVRAQARAAPLTPTWALLPDGQQVNAFRRRLLASGGALGVRVGTFDGLYTELLALADKPLPIAPEPVLHRLIQSVLDRLTEEGALRHYAPIRRRPGLALALNDLFAELKRSRVAPDALTGAMAESEPRLQELAAAYERYQAALIHAGWADSEGRGWLAIEALTHDPNLASGWHVVVDGFDSFTATQRETLRLLQARTGWLAVTLMGEGDLSRSAYRRFRTTLETLRADGLALTTQFLPGSRARPVILRDLADAIFDGRGQSRAARSVSASPGELASPVSFLEAQTQALEAREALRWIKARHLRDGVPLSDCAVIARDLELYVPYLTETAREFGLPLALVSGAPLETNPVVGALLNVLGLPLSDWERRPVLDLIRSPYIDLSGFGLMRQDAARIDAVARVGQVIAGLDQWREAFEIAAAEPAGHVEIEVLDEDLTPPSLPRGAVARTLGDGLLAGFARLTPPEPLTLRGYVAWVEDVIETLRIETALRQHPETEARDRAAMAALREVFAALVLSDTLFGQDGERTYAEFQTELRGAVAAARFIAGPRPTGAILAADLRRARGVPYAAVAVLGLAEGL